MIYDKIRSYAKINVALNIIGKTSTHHKIESIIFFVSLHDNIEIKQIKSNRHNVFFYGKFSRKIHKKNTVSKLLKFLDERKLLKDALGTELEDVFRIFEPGDKNWSWWDYRHSAWERDQGWRIDHIYLTEDILSSTNGCWIDKESRSREKPSDHAPVVVDINWPPSDFENEFF